MFKVGDKIKIVGNEARYSKESGPLHFLPLGTIADVANVRLAGADIEVSVDGYIQTVYPEHITLVEEGK